MKPLIHTLVQVVPVAAAVLLAACGVGDGPELGDFPAINKKQTDAPFTLTPPSSRSPAPFTFTSSNPAVATISGALVTIQGPGTSTITAAQNGIGSYGPTHKSTTLTVEAGGCDANQIVVNGTCTVPKVCVSPAAPVSDQCVAPSADVTGAATVSAVSLSWMGATRSLAWSDANGFCTGSVIDNQTGWRLPTPDELSRLYTANVLAGRGWKLGDTWSSTKGTTTQASHVVINLGTGVRSELADTAGAYVTCVR
jgi:hypothetical protein